MQLDLFEPDPIKVLWMEIQKLKASHETLRRGLFARYAQVEKKVKPKKKNKKQLYFL